ncbi:alpha/beta hydrolase [Williamsia sp. 1138]|nr:alpha/beta hydrolase [Williamsia sp. 1138]
MSIDGRNLHYCRAGQGPTVVFEAGLGKSRNTWAWVQPAVSSFASTVVYDRAGYGRSDPAPQDGGRPLEALLDDHQRLISEVVTGPYILVAHSYGGPIVRQAAMSDPANCRGVVLVDEVSEMCEEIVSGQAMRGANALYTAQIPLARLGLLSRLLTRTYYKGLRSPALAEITDEEGTLKHAQGAKAEWRAMLGSLARARDTGPWVPQCALTTISSNRSARHPEGGDFIFDSHASTAAMVPDGRHVTAATRSHYIQLTEPDFVVAEIRRMVDQLT